MNKLKVLIAAVLLAIGATSAVVITSSSPASATTTGSVDVLGWCANANPQRTPGDIVTTLVGIPQPYSWQCKYAAPGNIHPPYTTGVDMNAACAYTHPGHAGDAHLGSPYTAYNWYCVY